MAIALPPSSISWRTPWVPMVAALVAVAGVALIVRQGSVRILEAAAAAQLSSHLGVVQAQSVGRAVIFPLDGHFVGFYLSASCTVALLLSPFFLVTAGLLLGRRIGLGRGLRTLGAVSILLFVVNQLRLVVIAASMRLWGAHTGYEQSHVLLGTVVSTVGLVAGVVLFVVALARESQSRRAG